jgi:hypothetical protein
LLLEAKVQRVVLTVQALCGLGFGRAICKLGGNWFLKEAETVPTSSRRRKTLTR